MTTMRERLEAEWNHRGVRFANYFTRWVEDSWEANKLLPIKGKKAVRDVRRKAARDKLGQSGGTWRSSRAV